MVGLILSILEARLRRSLRRAESELQRRSFRDGLTRLPNRLMFEGTLAQAVQQADASGERMAMLFIDLDGFKPVNESLGHHMGDLMLREIAARLKRFARPDDRVAHLGGDEFLMLIRGNPSEEDAATFAERMQGQIGEPCKMNGREAAVSSSVGIAMYPEHGAMQDLIAHAEAAMRAAKSGGGATHCFFEPRMVSGAREQFDLLRDLRRALAEGQLHLRLPAQGACAERRDHRRRGADALEPSAARPGRADGLHSDRRALRPDRRDRQLADRRGLPPGGPVARRRPAHAGGDQPFGAPAAPCRPRRPDRRRAASAIASTRSC